MVVYTGQGSQHSPGIPLVNRFTEDFAVHYHDGVGP